MKTRSLRLQHRIALCSNASSKWFERNLYKTVRGGIHKEMSAEKAAKQTYRLLLRAQQAAKNNTATQGDGEKFEIKGKHFSKDHIQSNISEIPRMASVANLTGNEFAKSEVGLTDQVNDFFAKYNYTIENPEIGTVEISQRGAKDSIAHGVGRTKAVAFAAVPHTIANGKIVDYQTNWKNRQYDTLVLAAPISINGERYYQGVIVIRDKSNQRFYLHEVITEKEGETSFKTGAGAKHTPGDVSPSLVSILQKFRNVNVEDKKYDIKYSAKKSDIVANLVSTYNYTQETANKVFTNAYNLKKKTGSKADIQEVSAVIANALEKRRNGDFGESDITAVADLIASGSRTENKIEVCRVLIKE